jgi:hypothetical protein
MIRKVAAGFSKKIAPPGIPAPVLTRRVVRRYMLGESRAVSSVGEHFLDMEGVASSILAPPTSKINHLTAFSGPINSLGVALE